MRLLLYVNQICRETDRAVLIKVPNETNKRFWFPKSLLRDYGKRLIAYIPDDFEATVISGSKQISKIVETADYLFDHFQLLEDAQQLKPKSVIHKPEEKEPIERVVEDEFIR